MTKREEAIQKLSQARALLVDVAFIIQDECENGSQFDYCTSSQLADSSDSVLDVARKIDRLVYQK